MKLNKTKGMTLVEVVVGATIIGTSIIFIVGVYSGLSRLSYRNTARVQAAMLAEEAVEALRTMRDAGWTANVASLPYTTFGTTTTYRLIWDNTKWQATTSPVLIDGVFDRTFQIFPVNRDGAFNVVSTGGTEDTNSRRVVITISWREDNGTSTKSAETYLFNSFAN